MHHYSVTAKLVINCVNNTRYSRIIYGHTAAITCAGITRLYVIDREGKVVMELVSWQHRARV